MRTDCEDMLLREVPKIRALLETLVDLARKSEAREDRLERENWNKGFWREMDAIDKTLQEIKNAHQS